MNMDLLTKYVSIKKLNDWFWTIIDLNKQKYRQISTQEHAQKKRKLREKWTKTTKIDQMLTKLDQWACGKIGQYFFALDGLSNDDTLLWIYRKAWLGT